MPTSTRIVICAHCGFEGPHRAFGLCNACYFYQFRHGGALPPPRLPACRYCGGPHGQRYLRGICQRCRARAYKRGLRAADLHAGVPRAAVGLAG